MLDIVDVLCLTGEIGEDAIQKAEWLDFVQSLSRIYRALFGPPAARERITYLIKKGLEALERELGAPEEKTPAELAIAEA